MDPDLVTQPPEATTPPTPAPSDAAAITPAIQALIDKAAASAHNAAWKQARETFAGRKPDGASQPPPKQPDASTQPVTPDVAAFMKIRDDFDEAIGDLTLSAPQKRFIRDLVMEKRPDDVIGYVRTFAETLGVGKQQTSTQPAASGAMPAAGPTAMQPPMPGGAPPARVVSDERIVDMSPADRTALTARIGPFKFRERHMAEMRADTRRFALRR